MDRYDDGHVWSDERTCGGNYCSHALKWARGHQLTGFWPISFTVYMEQVLWRDVSRRSLTETWLVAASLCHKKKLWPLKIWFVVNHGWCTATKCELKKSCQNQKLMLKQLQNNDQNMNYICELRQKSTLWLIWSTGLWILNYDLCRSKRTKLQLLLPFFEVHTQTHINSQLQQPYLSITDSFMLLIRE